MRVCAGLVSKRPGQVEKEHHETGEQPDGDRLRVEPEPKYAVRSRSDQGTHAGVAGSELRRPFLNRH